MAQIATVMAVNGSGTAVIVDANGNTRPAVAGAPVMRGETVRTTGGARVELMMEDGDVVAINPNQTVRVDENMAQGDARPTPQEGGVASQAIDQVLQALEQGGDLTEELEAAAAGLGGGGDGEGGGIVQLLRISEGTDPLSYNFETSLTGQNSEEESDPDQPVNLAFTFDLEEESVASLNGNDETDDGLLSSRSGNFLDGVGGVLTVITVAGLGAVPIAAGGTTVAFDVNGQPIPPGSETPPAVLFKVFPDGEYSLEVVGRLNHPTPGTTEEQLSLPGITITGVAGTGGPLSATVGITVQDDVPELAGGRGDDDSESYYEEEPGVIRATLEEESAPALDGNDEADGLTFQASGDILGKVNWGVDGFGRVTGFSFEVAGGEEPVNPFPVNPFPGEDQPGGGQFQTAESESSEASGPRTVTLEVPEGGSTVLYLDSDGRPMLDGDDQPLQGEEGSAPEGAVVRVELGADGSYLVEVIGPLNHPVAGVEDFLSLPAFSVHAVDGDGDPISVDLRVEVQDDVPKIDVAEAQHLSESFENFTSLTGNSWTVVAENGGVVNGNQGIRWTLNEAGIEIQRGNVGDAAPSDGNFKAELDANNNAGGSPNTLTVLSTVLDVPSSTFTMTFDYQPRPADRGDSGMVVSLGGVNVTVSSSAVGVVSVDAPVGVKVEPASLTGSGTAAGGWTTITLTFSGVTPGLNTLSFQGLSDNANGDTLGALLDNIKLSANNPILVDETQLAVDATSGTAAALFSVSFGADGAAATNSKVYALTATNDVFTGLIDTGTREDVKVLLGTGADAGKVFGVVTEDGAQKVVFVMGVDPVTGMVSFDQQRAVVHPDGSNPNDTVSLAAGVIGLKLTATDADGDPVSAKVDVGRLVSIYDDAPIARDDSDTVVDGVAEGNVIGITGGAGADDPGADGPATVIGLTQGANSATKLEGGAFKLTGQSGTLTLQTNGQYTYTADPSKTTTVAASADQIGAVNGAAKAFTLGASFFTAGGLYNPAGATGTVTSGGAGGAFLGVAGAPAGQSVPEQINYVGSASEALAFGFGAGVSSATVGFSNLFQNENGGEAARWHAFDSAGNWVGSGVISNNADAPYANTTTTVNFTSNNAGTFTVSNIGVFTTLVVEAVPYAQDGDASNDDSDFFARVVGFQFHPEGEGAYTDTFQYTITDADGDTAQATLTITGERPDPGQQMKNDAPVAVGNTYEVVPGGSAAGNVITDDENEGGAASGRDWDQDTPVLNLSVKAVQWGDGKPVTLAPGDNVIRLAQGTLFIEPNGTFRYEPDRGASGEESFNYILQDVKGGVSEPALVTIGLPAPLGEWFIPQADNVNQQPTPDKTLVEGAGPQAGSWAFNVNYKQSAGSYAIAQGEKVTVTLDLWTPPGAAVATFGKDYALEVTGKNGFVVEDGWSLENGKLVVTVTPDTKGAPAPNLVGVVFEVSITALSDVVTESAGKLVGFDILGAEHQIGSVVKPLGAGQESNDDVLIKIEDPEGALLKAWSDNNNDGVLDQGDNLPKAFEVTQTQIDNSADAGNWIGNTLREGRALTTTQVANNMPRDLTLKVTSDVTFTFVSEGAGYKNAVGWYDLANPGVGFVVWGNASAQGSGGSLTSSSQVTVEDVPAGTKLGFFLIPDGHSLNSGGVPDKVYFKDGKAYADEAHTQLVNSNGGSNPGAVWFSNENGAGAKNLDGLQHAVTGLGQNEPASKLYVGFEDVAGGGDRDFNDVIFTVDLGSGNEIQFDPVVFDLGVDINYGGLLEGAVVQFSLAEGDSVFFDNAKANSLGLKVETTDGKKFAISSADDTPNGALDYNDLLDTFQIAVGNTGSNEDFTQVSEAARHASVTLLDLSGNFSDPVKATFNLDVKPDQI